MKKIKPDCPKCKSNINFVEFQTYFRCAFCGEKVIGKAGQITITNYIK